jgi:hypothetical protein
VPDERQVVVFLHDHWHQNPRTLNIDVNAIGTHLERLGHSGILTAVSIRRCLTTHSRFHGSGRNPDNVAPALSAEEVVAMLTARYGTGGKTSPELIDRGASAVILASEGVPLTQVARIVDTGVREGDDHVEVAIPAITAARGRRREWCGEPFVLQLPVTGDELCGRTLLRVATLELERSALLAYRASGQGVRSVEGAVRASDSSPGKLVEALSLQLRLAATRAGLTLGNPRELVDWPNEDLRRLIRHLNPSYVMGLRTRMHLAVLVSTGARHSDSAEMLVENMHHKTEGFHVFLPRSKTDQHGRGAWQLIPHFAGHPPTCPACLVQCWLDETGITEGPLVRSLTKGGGVKDGPVDAGHASNELDRLAKAAGIDRRISTHSGRRTFVTLQALAGAELADIEAITGQSQAVIVGHYIDLPNPFQRAAQT